MIFTHLFQLHVIYGCGWYDVIITSVLSLLVLLIKFIGQQRPTQGEKVPFEGIPLRFLCFGGRGGGGHHGLVGIFAN